MSVDHIPVQQCQSIDGPITMDIGKHRVSGLFSERHQPRCTCTAYRHSKGLTKSCKHIDEAMQSVCGWHSMYSDEPQTGEQVDSGTCPKCGGHTVMVMFIA